MPLELVQSICIIFLPTASPLNATNWPLGLNVLLFIAFLLVVAFSQVYRYRQVSHAMQRQQIKWALFGLVLYVVLLIGLSLVALIPGLTEPGSLSALVLNALYPLAALPLPLSIGIAVLRYRLWDIDAIINKALVYGGLSALLGVLYVGLIIGLESLIGLFSEQAASQSLVLVISTLVIAALFDPVRKRIQKSIDRRFYRRKYDAARTIEAFGATLQAELNLDQLSQHLLQVVTETMQPMHVSLWFVTVQGKEPRTQPLP